MQSCISTGIQQQYKGYSSTGIQQQQQRCTRYLSIGRQAEYLAQRIALVRLEEPSDPSVAVVCPAVHPLPARSGDVVDSRISEFKPSRAGSGVQGPLQVADQALTARVSIREVGESLIRRAD